MDELDKYKKAWENQPEDTNKVSKVDIYKMMKLKSSSVVKWIFIIGLIEFAFLILSHLFVDKDYADQQFESLGLKNTYLFFQILAIVIMIYFLRKFYLNYKNISVITNTKDLMTQILRTRKTVKNYFFANIFIFGFMAIVMFLKFLKDKFEVLSSTEIIVMAISYLIILVILLLVLWLFYQLIYGFLLRKLKNNYKELSNS